MEQKRNSYYGISWFATGTTNNISQVNSLLSKFYKIKPEADLVIWWFSDLSNFCFKTSKHDQEFLKSTSCLNKTQEKRKRDWFSQEHIPQRREKENQFWFFPLT